ncbi:hypothetical protein GCM10009805_21180 [Leucobacter chromiireducens subsp. solipictus]
MAAEVSGYPTVTNAPEIHEHLGENSPDGGRGPRISGAFVNGACAKPGPGNPVPPNVTGPE